MVLNEIPASTQIGFPILSMLVLLPAAAAAVIAFLPRQSEARAVAFACALAELALALVLAWKFVPGSPDIQFAEKTQWLAPGIGYHLGVDGLSVLFLPLTAFVMLMVIACSGQVRFQGRHYLAGLLLLESATMGIFAALDLILFYVFYELALVPSFFLISLWGAGPQRRHAAVKYLAFMLAGSVPLLLGFIVLALNHQEAHGTYSFDLVRLLAVPVDSRVQTAAFLLMAAGFAVKGPMLPFHGWMPTAVMEGPTGMAAYLVGLKIGIYGMLRFVLPLAPDASREWFWLLAALGLAAIVYGALIALVQPNFRRLIAFASVSHAGLLVVALFSFNAQGLQGAILLMLNAGIATAGLMLAAGFLHQRLGSTDLSAMGGIARQAPRMATFCFVAGLALIGMPGTIGFNAEFLAMTGAWRAHWLLGAGAVLGVVLGAGYFLWYYERAFFGPAASAAVTRLRDLNRTESLVAASVMALAFATGVYPKPLLETTAGSVTALTERIAAGALPASGHARLQTGAQTP